MEESYSYISSHILPRGVISYSALYYNIYTQVSKFNKAITLPGSRSRNLQVVKRDILKTCSRLVADLQSSIDSNKRLETAQSPTQCNLGRQVYYGSS